MAVAEKINPWVTQNYQNLKNSQPEYFQKKRSDEINKYILYRRIEPFRYPSFSIQSKIEATFAALANQWLAETRGLSSTNQMCMHPAYQQIIGMGEAVIPLLLRELEKKSGQWFWALKSITREDPVPPEHRGKTKDMIKIWLEWGRQRGYKW
ncbi:MAG TPA: hypothetical protein VK184_22015 [Nostocaceae cyanobacterium]|nr:hypothetical protein [Nostocaceae cyanobacterium]